MEEISSFKESNKISVLSPVSKKEGKDWDVVLIEAGMSLNGNFYPPDVLRNAAPLFEGLKACAYRFGQNLDSKFDHLPEKVGEIKSGGFAENVVGWFESVRYGTFKKSDGSEGEGILARFHVFEGAKWLRDNLKDAWSHAQQGLLGFSIDALGTARDGLYEGKRVKFVEKIEKVNSTDIVSQPAAGGAVLRMVASVKGENMENIMDLVKKHRNEWLSGFSGPEDEESMKDYALRVFESNISNAQKILSQIDVSDVKALQEAAHGLKVLNGILQMMKGGQSDKAAKMLQDFISSNPLTENINSYSFFQKKEHIQEASKLGDFLRAEAKKQEVSTKQLADAAGIDAGTVNQIMDGSIQRPPDQRLRGFARVLKISFDRLLNMIPEGIRESVDGTFEEITNNEMEQEMDLKEKENKLKVRESGILIKERLLMSGLTEKSQGRISKLFEGKIDITAEKIDEAIKEEKEYIASFSESGKVTGLGDAHDDKGRVEVTKEQNQKISDAFDGLFESADVNGVPRFTSLKHAWGVVNGEGCWRSPEQTAHMIFESIARSLPGKISQEENSPYDKHKRYLKESFSHIYSSNLREAVTTSDFSATFGDALFRRLQKEYTQDPRNDWRRIVSSIENLTDATNKFTVIRAFTGVNDLPVVAERGAYQELNPTRSENTEDIQPAKHGGLEKLTWEDILADRLGAIRRIPRILAQASNRTIHKAVWNEIEANPVLSNGNALISAGNNNQISGDPVLSYGAVTDGIQLLRDQTDPDNSEKLGLMPAWLLTGTKLENEAFEITESGVKVSGAEDATVINAVKSKYGVKAFSTLGLGRTTTTDDHFWVAASPRDTDTIAIGFLGGRDRPDIFIQGQDTPNVGAMFDADEITFKIRSVFGVKIVDHRWISGSLKA